MIEYLGIRLCRRYVTNDGCCYRIKGDTYYLDFEPVGHFVTTTPIGLIFELSWNTDRIIVIASNGFAYWLDRAKHLHHEKVTQRHLQQSHDLIQGPIYTV